MNNKTFLSSILFLICFFCTHALAFADKDVKAYVSRIASNGGTISATDRSALETFVTSAKKRGYWSKLIDVGPLAGDNLSAALVKLKYPAGGTSLLTNNGFTDSDYIAANGLSLSGGKYLNTRTNLSTLNLGGLFGLSFAMSNGGTGWIGSSNGATPYCILIASPNSAIAYVGSGNAGNAIGGGTNGSIDNVYHLSQQALNSTKLFVNGIQLGATGTTEISNQNRNDDVYVFRDSGNTGSGFFYSVDDGTLTDSQLTFFHYDVQTLISDLGRKVAPPVISSEGLHTTYQTVTITQPPTISALGGATIYYTLDGTTPTTASPVYTTPLIISSPTEIKAIAVKGTRQSLVKSVWVAIVPPGFSNTKYYTAHVMVNLMGFTNNMDAWLEEMKASGYNLIWAHLDDYDGQYPPALARLFDSAKRVGGIQIMPGPSWWVPTDRVIQMYKDTWDEPALFKINGKRVYTGWDYQPYNAVALDTALTNAGYPKSQYYTWVSSRYPYSYDGGVTWVGEYVGPDGYRYYESKGAAANVGEVHHLYDTRPMFDGIINFAVDQGGLEASKLTNKLLTDVSIQRGKFSMTGISAYYASVSFHDYGFAGAADLWNAILAPAPVNRSTAMSDTTADDYAELSYMSPTVVPPTNGLSYIPAPSAGFNLGENVRYPLTDHSGIQKFLRPWVNAFLNNETAPSFTQDKLFAWYWLHPANVQPTSTIPSVFAGYPHLNQAWWNTTLYSTGYNQVGGTNQVDGIKNLSGFGFTIRLAAHLTSPARLRINDTLSEIFPAGPAYFEIPMGTFRGTPTFAIVRAGSQDKAGNGPQAITDNVFPGGWNFLAVEIPLSNTPPPNPTTATTFTFNGPTRGTINTASANFTVTPNNPYTGTITVTPSGGGLTNPIVLSFTSASPQTFTLTPTSAGRVILTPTNNGSLTNPRELSFTACPNKWANIKNCGN